MTSYIWHDATGRKAAAARGEIDRDMTKGSTTWIVFFFSFLTFCFNYIGLDDNHRCPVAFSCKSISFFLLNILNIAFMFISFFTAYICTLLRFFALHHHQLSVSGIVRHHQQECALCHLHLHVRYKIKMWTYTEKQLRSATSGEKLCK